MLRIVRDELSIKHKATTISTHVKMKDILSDRLINVLLNKEVWNYH